MSPSRVRLHVLGAGHMTGAMSGFLRGEAGDITFPVPIYVIEHPQGLVLIDTGLHPELIETTQRLRRLADSFQFHLAADGSQACAAVLRSAGFDPALVTHVILTHLHFDHGGGLLQIPNATLLVQGREWQVLSDSAQVELGAYNPDDVDLGHQRMELDGDHDVFGDGTVTCLLTDGHTPGHQSVRVRTETGVYVVCGDCCYLRRSLENEHLPAFCYNSERQLESIRRLVREKDKEGATLLFGHDPEQFRRIAEDGLNSGV